MSAPRRYSSEDLVARAVGSLPPAEAQALDAAMRSDTALRQEFEKVAAHLLLYEGVSEAPPPPPFESIASRLDEAPATELRLRVRLYRLAAASVAAAAVVAVILWSKAPSSTPAHEPVRVAIRAATNVKVFRNQNDAVPLADARAGDTVLAFDPGTLQIGGRARVGVDKFTTLVLVSDDEVRLEGGRAEFDVSHLPPSLDGRVPADAPAIAFRVRTADVNVEVRGTRFAVEVYEPPNPTAERQLVLVDVEGGVVSANDVRVGAGERRLFVGSEAVAIESRAIAVTLEAAEAPDAPLRAGGPVAVRMVLSNPTDAPVAVPVRDGVASPIFIEVSSPAMSWVPIRVTPNMLIDVASVPKVIPPHGRVALTVRFERSFPVVGTYRLRVLFQPASAVLSPGSGDLVLDIR